MCICAQTWKSILKNSKQATEFCLQLDDMLYYLTMPALFKACF